jgi:hypothetical protein
MFSLRKRGCCSTKKQVLGRPRRFSRLYPTKIACGKRGTSVTQEKTGLIDTGKYPLQPGGRIATLTNSMNCAEQRRVGACRLTLAVIVAMTAATSAIWAQDSKPSEMAPGELVRLTVANEVAAANHPEIHHMFHSRRQTAKGVQTRVYVETNQALAGMLIAANDQPLTAEQQKAETDRLASLASNPDQLRRKAAREKEDGDRSLRIVKALPDAFCYEYAGTENSETALGKTGDQLVKLKFKPNPAYNPPSHVEQVLTGMQGELLIDPETKRLARIDGTLFQEVTFGWGILGHLNKGGHFRVQQADLGLEDGSWGITQVSLNMTGKILMFKDINMVSDEVLSDFHRMPERLTFAQGVEMLKIEEVKPGHNFHAAETTEAKKDQSN